MKTNSKLLDSFLKAIMIDFIVQSLTNRTNDFIDYGIGETLIISMQRYGESNPGLMTENHPS